MICLYYLNVSKNFFICNDMCNIKFILLIENLKFLINLMYFFRLVNIVNFFLNGFFLKYRLKIVVLFFFLFF